MLRLFQSLTIIITVFLFTSCAPIHKPIESRQVTSPTRKVSGFLSKSHADLRAHQISNVDYDLYFTFDTQSKVFQGTTTIDFDYTPTLTHAPITIDFRDGAIAEVTVNGNTIEAVSYNGYFITIDAQHLIKGTNVITITYTHPYSTTGSGLHRFVDPEDNRIYLYTDFEPYDANRLFPCFDQPNLKATYTVTVDAPSPWTVVTSTLESSKEPIDETTTRWHFPTSKRYSTYIFPLHAGPYYVWKSTAGEVPLRLFARQSMKTYVGVEDWFTFTQQGFEFFQNYFDYPYPFEKYDQLVVPEFNSGAMENVGAVTFNERYTPRSEPTQEQRQNTASVILHGLSHMWFGNLVTMNWWNDLWLNEAFAVVITHMALAEATEFKESWQDFHAGTKSWGYWQDQLVTTHPIEASTPTTDDAFTNFDGITYGKGAAVLRQLAYYLGEDNFQAGLRRYFKTFEYSNTTASDFFNTLSGVAEKSLMNWRSDWLRTSEVNTIDVTYTCQEDWIQSFFLNQTAKAQYPAIRPHRTQIALFNRSSTGKIKPYKTVSVTYHKVITPVPELIGVACPKMVFPNYGDYDYVKVQLDPGTLRFINANLSDISEPFTRLMIWKTLWDMVTEGQLSVIDYSELMFAHIPKESDAIIVNFVMESVYNNRSGRSNVIGYLPFQTDQDNQFRAAYIQKLEKFLWTQLKNATPGTDTQKRWLDSYVLIAQTPNALTNLHGILSNQINFKALNIDQDRRWQIVVKLAESRYPGHAKLIQRELQRDNTDTGQKAALRAQAVQPTLKNKRSLLNQLHNNGSELPLSAQKTIMKNLFPINQVALRSRFADEFFKKLPTLSQTRDHVFMRYYAAYLAPTTCTIESVAQIETFISNRASDLSPVTLKYLKIANQENNRCVRATTLAQKTVRSPNLAKKALNGTLLVR